LSYDGNGFLAGATDPLGRTVAFAHDADGRVIEETLPDSRVMRFAYDLDGNLATLTPPGRLDHTLSYDPRDELTTYTPPALGAEQDAEQYGYNADRQPLRVDRADGQTVQFQYDAAGRSSTLGLASGNLSYGYDAASRLTSLRAPAASLALAYDGALPIGETWSGAVAGSVARCFDNDFRVISDSVNGSGALAIQYDADSLRTQVGGLSLTRSAQTGFLIAASLGSKSETPGYDGFGDLLHYTASQSGSALYARDLTRDAIGRITSKTETLGGATHVFAYTYDLAGRLTEVCQDGVLTESYAYDANGNRTTATAAGGPLAASYDAQDRLTQYGAATFTHTPNGERQSKSVGGQTTTYRYDSLSRLAGATLPSGTQIDYVLDGGQRRVGKRVNGALVQGFLYQDGLRPIAELDGAGNVVSRFVYAGGAVPAYLTRAGATFRVIADQLGSPRLVVDVATGAVAQRLDYDTFGNVTLDSNPGFQPFDFAGGLYDRDTSLLHFGAREYDPQTGRWTTKDPIHFAGGDSNLYAYVGNDPVNGLDVTGLAGVLNSPLSSLTVGLARMCSVDPVSCAAVAGGAAAAGQEAAVLAEGPGEAVARGEFEAGGGMEGARRPDLHRARREWSRGSDRPGAH
jgi:RHS repeat-associated protein